MKMNTEIKPHNDKIPQNNIIMFIVIVTMAIVVIIIPITIAVNTNTFYDIYLQDDNKIYNCYESGYQILKCVDSTTHWYYQDSQKSIVSINDYYCSVDFEQQSFLFISIDKQYLKCVGTDRLLEDREDYLKQYNNSDLIKQ